MKEVIISMLALLFKNELGDWPHQYLHPAGWLIFGVPMIAGYIDQGIVAALIFGAPLIVMILIQRFVPI